MWTAYIERLRGLSNNVGQQLPSLSIMENFFSTLQKLEKSVAEGLKDNSFGSSKNDDSQKESSTTSTILQIPPYANNFKFKSRADSALSPGNPSSLERAASQESDAQEVLRHVKKIAQDIERLKLLAGLQF